MLHDPVALGIAIVCVIGMVVCFTLLIRDAVRRRRSD